MEDGASRSREHRESKLKPGKRPILVWESLRPSMMERVWGGQPTARLLHPTGALGLVEAAIKLHSQQQQCQGLL